MAVDMSFLTKQEQLFSRLVSSAGGSVIAVGAHKLKRPVSGATIVQGDQSSCEWCDRQSSRVKNTKEGLLCGVCQLKCDDCARISLAGTLDS
jgi:hypothetical protein